MKIKYTRNELANIIKSVRAAEGSDDLPIHNWARAAKVLEAEAASRKELLREANYFLEYIPVGIEGEEERYHKLMHELEEKLGDD